MLILEKEYQSLNSGVANDVYIYGFDFVEFQFWRIISLLHRLECDWLTKADDG